VMQGRLSPLYDNKIQSFPWETWQQEFELLFQLGLRRLEWTIDSKDFASNPLLLKQGQAEINSLKDKWGIEVSSITCDYFMDNPPWKTLESRVIEGITTIAQAMAPIGARILVIPLVDHSSMMRNVDYLHVRDFFSQVVDILDSNDLKIAFETDLDPGQFMKFLSLFPDNLFGVNYDMGNSAALGYDPDEEIGSYGDRIINVHVKDRPLGGISVPLGQGDVNFPKVFSRLEQSGYSGNIILQTARARNGDHLQAIKSYTSQVSQYMTEVNVV